MANVNIVEGRAGGAAAGTQVMRLPGVAKQAIAIGSASVRSSPFNSDTNLIRVHAEAACTIKVGDSGVTATASDEVTMDAGDKEYFAVSPGQTLAVITR